MSNDVKPIGTVVKLEEAEYYKLRTRIAEADAAVVRANALLAVKDALFKDLAAKYDFDPSFKRIQWDDATCEFAFS